jgi:hypothetical protein
MRAVLHGLLFGPAIRTGGAFERFAGINALARRANQYPSLPANPAGGKLRVSPSQSLVLGHCAALR